MSSLSPLSVGGQNIILSGFPEYVKFIRRRFMQSSKEKYPSDPKRHGGVPNNVPGQVPGEGARGRMSGYRLLVFESNTVSVDNPAITDLSRVNSASKLSCRPV